MYKNVYFVLPMPALHSMMVWDPGKSDLQKERTMNYMWSFHSSDGSHTTFTIV